MKSHKTRMTQIIHQKKKIHHSQLIVLVLVTLVESRLFYNRRQLDRKKPGQQYRSSSFAPKYNQGNDNYNSNRAPPKRNNRHVNLLDHRSHQPAGKRTKQGQSYQPQSGQSSRDSAPGDFEDYRRSYQNRLRSFTIDR